MAFWMLNAIVRNEQLGDPDRRLAQLGRTIVSETVEDFRCAPPKAIIVARPGPAERGFDILGFFLRDPAFADLLSHYKARPWAGYQTVRPGLATAPPKLGLPVGDLKVSLSLGI